jgi:hypothetical protein
MKLTTQQIAKIEETLVLNGLIYDDIKLEVTDHIASEIEAEIEEKEISFEMAFKKAFENWKEQLRPSTSLWVDMKDAVPRIVLNKWILESKKKLLKGTLIGLILAILFTIFEKNINNEIVFTNIRAILKVVFILELTFILVGKFLIWKSVQKTFFGFIFQKQTKFAVLFLLFMLGIGVMPIVSVGIDLKVNLAANFLFMVYIILPIYYLQLAYKHFQFERKLKLS